MKADYMHEDGLDFDAFKKKAAGDKDVLIRFLEKFDRQIPDGIAHTADEAEKVVWAAIDCKVCAGCCKMMTPVFTGEDVQRISHALNMSEEKFEEQYTEIEKDTGRRVIQEWPCSFLENSLCTIYSVRPDDCAGFPYLDKRPFDEYYETHVQNIDKCPATYEFIKLIKEKVEAVYEW